MPASQFVILSKKPATANGMAPIGRRDEIVFDLARFNTGPENQGDDILYGPGIMIELPPSEPIISQMLMTIIEDEIAWLVIMRLAKNFQWKIVDPNTGRELNS